MDNAIVQTMSPAQFPEQGLAHGVAFCSRHNAVGVGCGWVEGVCKIPTLSSHNGHLNKVFFNVH